VRKRYLRGLAKVWQETWRRGLTTELVARVHRGGDDGDVLHDRQRAGAPHLAQHADRRPQDAALAAAGAPNAAVSGTQKQALQVIWHTSRARDGAGCAHGAVQLSTDSPGGAEGGEDGVLKRGAHRLAAEHRRGALGY